MFDCAGNSIQNVRSSGAGPGPGVANKPIALESYQMRPNCVVGQLQFGCQFVDRSVALPQQCEDFAAGAFDQPFTPW